MEGRDAKARNLWGTSAAPLLPQGGAPSYSRRDRPWFDHRSDSCISARLHPNSSGRGYECSKNSASTMCGSGTQGCPGVRPEFLPLQNLPVLAGVRGIRSLSRSDVRWSREVAARPARPAANLRSSSPTPGYLLTTTPELAATLMRPHLASRTGGLCEPSVRSSLRTFDAMLCETDHDLLQPGELPHSRHTALFCRSGSRGSHQSEPQDPAPYGY
jgi:hypothetical protein